MDIGYTVSRFTEIRVGYEVATTMPNCDWGLRSFSLMQAALAIRAYTFSPITASTPSFPTADTAWMEHFGGSIPTPAKTARSPLMQARADYFLPVQSAASVFVVGEGGTSFGSTHIGVPQFFLGGPGGSALTARMNLSETNTMTSELATCTIWLRCRRSLGEECMRLAPRNSEKCMALPTRVDSPMISLREF
jgi:hypothetical protein